MTALSRDEQTALRLFHLLNDGAKTDFIKTSFESLVPFADTDNDVETFLRDVRPWDWPGRQYVDLENLPDPNYWLDDIMGEPEIEILFGHCRDQDEATAHHMAEQFYIETVPRGFQPPSFFIKDEEEIDDIALFQEDFMRFLAHWREAALKALELSKQC